MSPLFLVLVCVLFGGVSSLFLAKSAKLSKTLAVVFIGGGSLWGMVYALGSLKAGGGSAAFTFLNVFDLVFKVDGLSAFFLFVIFAVSLMAGIYSYHYMDNPKQSVGTAVGYLFFSILTASMALVVTADNMIAFLLSWELMSLSSFFLVIHNYKSKESRKAGILYFVFSHVGVMFILAGFGLIYGYTGSFAFSGLGGIPESVKLLILIFTFIGFGSKAGVFPFHVWLPHAHPAAPSHISAVMSGVMIKIGIYGILRMYTILEFYSPVFGYIVLLSGMVTGILGVVYALGQNDIKRLLAYSSVENVGIILIGSGIGMIGVSTGHSMMALLGFSGAILHVLNHGIFKSMLFMGAGMVLHKTGTRTIDLLGGLLKSMKITGTVFIVGSLAIAGLPPFNGFVSEFFIYLGSFKGVGLEGGPLVMGILAIISLAVIGGLALACFTRVVGIVFQGEPRSQMAQNCDEKGGAMTFSMAVLAAACILIGIFPAKFLNMAVLAVAGMGLPGDKLAVAPFEVITAGHIAANITFGALVFLTVLVVVACIRSLAYRGKPMGRSGTWGCGFTQPTAKMQYTGSSYAGSILEFFGKTAPLEEDHPPIRGRFPAKTYYKSRIHDIAELQMNRAVVKPVLYFFDRLR